MKCRAFMKWDDGKRTRAQAAALICVILFLATFFPVLALAGTWKVQTVDSAAGLNGGEVTSLALDSSGRPHISYSDDQNFALKYASFDGSAWTKTTVEAGGVGIYISLALDSGGYPPYRLHRLQLHRNGRL